MNERFDWNGFSRRQFMAGAAGAGLVAGLPASVLAQAAGPIQKRKIPHSGEELPVVGIGTAIIFDIQNDAAAKAERKLVIEELLKGGGSLIDTAPAYGAAETVLGEVCAGIANRDKLFLATKVGQGSPAEMKASMEGSLQRLRVDKVALMQYWNVRAGADLGAINEFKAAGKCRYVGITTSSERAYDDVAEVLGRAKPDFFQVNYSLESRESDKKLIPMAKDQGAAVLINLPFGRNQLFKKTAGKPLPDWAKEIQATSWAQVFLKFILSTPGVNAVIPGTDKPQYMLDNLNAGRGPMPDAAMRKTIIDYWESL